MRRQAKSTELENIFLDVRRFPDLGIDRGGGPAALSAGPALNFRFARRTALVADESRWADEKRP
jgi:hypothetical protein